MNKIEYVSISVKYRSQVISVLFHVFPCSKLEESWDYHQLRFLGKEQDQWQVPFSDLVFFNRITI